jgi:hypothetical protein
MTNWRRLAAAELRTWRRLKSDAMASRCIALLVPAAGFSCSFDIY